MYLESSTTPVLLSFYYPIPEAHDTLLPQFRFNIDDLAAVKYKHDPLYLFISIKTLYV